MVGIELGRVCFRRRATTLTLSVARWVLNSAMATFPEAPYNCRTAEFPRSGLKSWPLVREPSPSLRGSSTRSPLLRPKPRSRSLRRLLPAPAAGGTFPRAGFSLFWESHHDPAHAIRLFRVVYYFVFLGWIAPVSLGGCCGKNRILKNGVYTQSFVNERYFNS
jgi:hypothetical protein